MRELASIRDEWLDDALPTLIADPRVVGVALVGSLGRGEADDWSDVDLLIVVDAAHLARFTDPSQNRLWDEAEVLVDARQNAPAGATSVGTLYVRSGLPLGVDWYVYPTSMAAWPSDSRVIHETAELRRIDEDFATFNSSGPRQAGTTKTADEIRQARLAMAPIAGKYIARRSPAAGPMIQFLGDTTQPVGPTPTDQLQALRHIVARLSPTAPSLLAQAVDSYLELVASDLTSGDS